MMDRPGTAPVGDVDRITAFLGMGTNTGDRRAALQAAVRGLSAQDGIVVDAVSPVYQTEAHVLSGQAPQPDHLNAVARLTTSLSPAALLATFQALERAAGRDPEAPRWSPRPLDLDLLLYGDAVIDRPGLIVPHPRLSERRFVLQPLADLAPGRIVPVLGLSVAALLAACPDASRIDLTDFALA